MSPQLNISAGELFELIRPAALILSALVSTWVFASALKRFPFFVALLWALATLLLPPIVLPLYLIALFVRPVSASSSHGRRRIIATLSYAALALAGTGFYLQQETRGVDAHLAQAAYAKVRGNHGRAIAEYRAALNERDDPHTHKLLGIELVAADYRTEALAEFRLAEKGGEPDDVMILRIASLLDALNMPGQAELEYRRFLDSGACVQQLPDRRCENARRKIDNSAGELR